MDAVISHVIKSALISGILYSYYLMALRNKKFHSYNRYYLLFTIGISLILPLINLKWHQIIEEQSHSFDSLFKHSQCQSNKSISHASWWRQFAFAPKCLDKLNTLWNPVIQNNLDL